MLELDLNVEAESVQLLLRHVVDETPRQLFAAEELNSQVLRTMAGHRLRVCLRENLRVVSIGLWDSRLGPGGHENISGYIAF
jgi:hypothetical protein